MSKSTQLISLVLAAGTSGVAVFSLANASFLAGLPGDVVLGVGASVAIFGLAIFDYSRRARSLTAPARLLRPTLPTAACTPERNDSRSNRAAA
jgi:hypothetical protein